MWRPTGQDAGGQLSLHFPGLQTARGREAMPAGLTTRRHSRYELHDGACFLDQRGRDFPSRSPHAFKDPNPPMKSLRPPTWPVPLLRCLDVALFARRAAWRPGALCLAPAMHRGASASPMRWRWRCGRQHRRGLHAMQPDAASTQEAAAARGLPDRCPQACSQGRLAPPLGARFGPVETGFRVSFWVPFEAASAIEKRVRLLSKKEQVSAQSNGGSRPSSAFICPQAFWGAKGGSLPSLLSRLPMKIKSCAGSAASWACAPKDREPGRAVCFAKGRSLAWESTDCSGTQGAGQGLPWWRGGRRRAQVFLCRACRLSYPIQRRAWRR